MTANSKEREFRYICQWFSEFSELQREDFVPVLVDYLKKEEIYMNGVVNSLSGTGFDDKPMSLYQCRIKLFKEWSPKWPEDMKLKLKEKIIELDSKIGEKLEQELSTTVGQENGFLSNGKENGHIEVELDKKENDETNNDLNNIQQSQNNVEEIQLDEQIPEEQENEQNLANKEDTEEEENKNE